MRHVLDATSALQIFQQFFFLKCRMQETHKQRSLFHVYVAGVIDSVWRSKSHTVYERDWDESGLSATTAFVLRITFIFQRFIHFGNEFTAENVGKKQIVNCN